MNIKYLVITALGLNAVATAEETAPAYITELVPFVVIGTQTEEYGSQAGLELAGPQDSITREQLRYEHPNDTLELFSKLPGVNLARYNQGIINTDIAIRGFGTDGVTPHAKLLIDGIPSNIHNGYNELDQMFPLAIGEIQTSKGTSDLRYGLYNVAGSYNVFSRRDIGSEIQVTFDTFGSAEFQGYSGLEQGDFTHNYFVGYRDGQGYRDHSDIEKYAFSGIWSYDLGDGLSIGLSARTSGYEGDSPGYLDKDVARSEPKSSAPYASEDGGKKKIHQISVFAEKEWDNNSLSVRAYYNDIYRNRLVRFSQAGSLRDRTDDQQISGVIADYIHSLSDNLRIKAGFEFQNQEVEEFRFDVNRVRRDWDFDLQNYGAYLGAEHDATDKFSWNVGVRVDQLEGDFTNKATDTSSSIRDFGLIVQPKLNLFYEASETVTLFASYGRTFQAPFGNALFETNTRNYDVNMNDGFELGLTYQPNENATMRLSIWNQIAENEYQDDQVNFTGYQELGEVDRRGVEFAFSYDINEKLNIWGNYAYSMSDIKESSADFAESKGNEVRGTPNNTYSFGVSYDLSDELTVRMNYEGQGDYYVNEKNEGGKFGGYDILSLGLDLETRFGLFTLQVNNLTDEYYEYVYDFSDNGTGTIHSPGDGINASISYSLSF
tara:strand:+ start:582 stop:2561 length:1980 start_codon:yes stop_codon:yes gene_type:complete